MGAGRHKPWLASDLIRFLDTYTQDRGRRNTSFTLSLLIRSVLVRHKEEQRKINEQLPHAGI